MRATLITTMLVSAAAFRDSAGPLDVTVDEMSDASFPASDPPERWTWEVRTTAADADGSDDSSVGLADRSEVLKPDRTHEAGSSIPLRSSHRM